jgi:hypothetical protein
VMSDPAVSAQAGPTEAMMGIHAASFGDFFRGQTQSLYAHLCLITSNRAVGARIDIDEGKLLAQVEDGRFPGEYPASAIFLAR